jgi:hypothetical protein
MLSDLAELAEHLEVPQHSGSIAELFSVIDRLQAKAAVAVGSYDAQGLFEVDGAGSMTSWLRQHTGVPNPSQVVKTARRMRQLPVTAAAWQDGTLSGAQVQAIVGTVDDATIDQLQEHETDLVPVLAPLSAVDVLTVMRQWKADAEAHNQTEPDTSSTAHLSPLLDGRGRLDADLDADGYQLAKTAFRLAETPDAEGEARTAVQRRGDALKDILRFFLDHQNHKPKNRNRPHVSLVSDWNRFADGRGGTYTDGTPASPATINKTLCDAGINRVVTDGRSVILDYGTTVYPFSDAQFQALILRDQHCRHAGCDRPPEWCEAHHVRPWPLGPTSLSNAVLKCSRHHHLGHRPGWTETLEPDGTYHLTAPDGRTWTTTPPGILTRISEAA